jgi:hypothetical protein
MAWREHTSDKLSVKMDSANYIIETITLNNDSVVMCSFLVLFMLTIYNLASPVAMYTESQII